MGATPRSWGCMPRRRRPGCEMEVCGSAVAWGGTPAFEAAPQTCWSTRKIPVQSARVSDGHSTSLRPDTGKTLLKVSPAQRWLCSVCETAFYGRLQSSSRHASSVKTLAPWSYSGAATWHLGAGVDVSKIKSDWSEQQPAANKGCLNVCTLCWLPVAHSVFVRPCLCGEILALLYVFLLLWVELWSELSDYFFVSCSQLKADKGVALPERAPLQTDGFNSNGVAGDNRRACDKDIVIVFSPQRNPL